METNQHPLLSEPKRSFLRIPVSIPARLVLDKKWSQKATITNLSSKGVALATFPSKKIPQNFQIVFRLFPWFKKLRMALVIKSSKPTNGNVRIGTAFVNLSQEHQEIIDRYILNFVNMHTPRALINTAAFLISFDALLKIFSYLIYRYYETTPWGATLPSATPFRGYGIILGIYLFSAISSFIVTERTYDVRKNNFLHALWFFIPSAIFLNIKAIQFITTFWNTPASPLVGIILFQIILTIYTNISLMLAIGMFRKINKSINALDVHLSGLENRKDHPTPKAKTSFKAKEYIRLSSQLNITILPVDDYDYFLPSSPGELKGLPLYGFSLTAKSQLPRGSIVTVDITHSEITSPLSLYAKVVWSSPNRYDVETEQTFDTGIAIISLSNENKKKLLSLVRKAPSQEKTT